MPKKIKDTKYPQGYIKKRKRKRENSKFQLQLLLLVLLVEHSA
jgi:hypothetical protein